MTCKIKHLNNQGKNCCFVDNYKSNFLLRSKRKGINFYDQLTRKSFNKQVLYKTNKLTDETLYIR